MSPIEIRQLHRLARLHGVQLSYVDTEGHTRKAPPETLMAVLRALGNPIETAGQIADCFHAAILRRGRQCLEPVTVAWNGTATRVTVRLAAQPDVRKSVFRLKLEDGQELNLTLATGQKASRSGKAGGMASIEAQLELPATPLGYHRLEAETPSGFFRSLVISAPVKSYSEPEAVRQWGLFLPMYAAHSRQSWGAGNIGDWQKLAEWAASLGGGVAASLPLLAAFLECPTCEPSPYSPASRLFWNEFYLEIERVPEFVQCFEARNLVQSTGFQKELAALRRSREIDYAREGAVRRQVLELLSRALHSTSSPRREALERFLHVRPEVREYARFRAACDQSRTSWHSWPEQQRNGQLSPADYDEAKCQYHCYVQWLAQEQVAGLVDSCRARGIKLYLDLPLGVHPDGYDVWREREVFTSGASAGAPPDAFFSKGQDWGFAPLHPQANREQGYRYVLEYLRFQMRHTGLLRIDHVMGLHRLYWVPRGMPADQGAYVTYPADESYALLCLESVRHKTVLVGENLGTVPPTVTARMKRHDLRTMYVVQFEQRPDQRAPLPAPPARCVASLNTHDMPTLAAHWNGHDIADRADLGLVPEGEIWREQNRRKKLNAALLSFFRRKGWLSARSSPPTDAAVLRACLLWLGASPAELVLANLEDLWLEKAPQNVPGTSRERPNWQRKARLTIEEIAADPRICEVLKELDRLRKAGGA